MTQEDRWNKRYNEVKDQKNRLLMVMETVASAVVSFFVGGFDGFDMLKRL